MCAVHHLSLDIETYSDVDIGKAGLYKYAQSRLFKFFCWRTVSMAARCRCWTLRNPEAGCLTGFLGP